MSEETSNPYSPFVTKCCGELVPLVLVGVYSTCKKHGKTLVVERYKYSKRDTYKGERGQGMSEEEQEKYGQANELARDAIAEMEDDESQ
tara:strand:- start:2064 stop:2330 length:267 start_codon:yes stop_codon:yes gene_type:complete